METDTIYSLLDVAAEHGGSLVWAVTKGVLVWGAIGFLAALGVYVAARRLLVRLADPKRRWPRVVFGLVVFLLAWPMIMGAGALTGLRDSTLASVRHEVADTEVVAYLGAVLVAPTVLAHLAASEPSALDGLDWAAVTSRDLGFLLSDGTRDDVFARLTSELARQALALMPAGRENAVFRWLAGQAEELAAAQVQKGVRRYLALLSGLQPDAPGQLAFASASRQVGRAFLDREVMPVLAAPFDNARSMLLLGAFLLIAVTLVLIHAIARRQPKASAASAG